ncbi:DMT family transporter, partial [Candidatus Gottesmanbacteria bacterium]|nr:DMT family transporter [Candidatus Gottesmanbacteria bacterium]
LPFFLRATPKLTKKLIIDIIPVSLFSTGNFLLFLFGINKTTANASAIIYTATPITVALLSGAFIGERVSRQKITGILLGLVGVMTILLLPLIEKGQVIIGDVGGNIIIIGAMIMFALYNVGTRHLTAVKSYHPITITGISIFISAMCFDLLLLFLPHKEILPSLLTPYNIFSTFYIAIFVTVIPYIFHQWAIKHSSATTGALTTYIQPIFGFVINGVLLGEVITGGFLFGSILVFTGTFMGTGARMIEEIKKILQRLR